MYQIAQKMHEPDSFTALEFNIMDTVHFISKQTY